MEVEVDVLGSLSLTVLAVSVDVNSPCGLCGLLSNSEQVSELGSCVKVEVHVLGTPSLIVLVVSVDS